MTHLVDKLVDLGLVRREMGKVDRRVINIMLTNKARAILVEHEGRVKDAIQETLAGLTGEELEDLLSSLKKLRDIVAKLP